MKLKGWKFMLSGLVIACGVAVAPASAQMFINAVTGQPLDLDAGREEERDTPAVKEFLQTMQNPYNEDPQALPKGESLFNTACSGCHGHLGEGKIGPALNHDGWHYELETDKGLFEVIFDGADRQMGPQNEFLTQDEILHVMAWVRHLYTGDPDDATWLTEEQRSSFQPYEEAPSK
ncbi:cytochrome c(L), periplasmic [Paenalcaligenes niemegkensis]|uniref:cytochrome c(L), periplasmic n=1 Tax=Paenalcaligenes niemegkensis TaxID=2895469 RepID=UPI001EE8AA71|nr:cytochrome c(L), periplasmic [Paenalcaligenes niemegkensis]MCQ9615831.1 cytochrome c(L), periplasmic [Paenalcaligenes niemegkensis]